MLKKKKKFVKAVKRAKVLKPVKPGKFFAKKLIVKRIVPKKKKVKKDVSKRRRVSTKPIKKKSVALKKPSKSIFARPDVKKAVKKSALGKNKVKKQFLKKTPEIILRKKKAILHRPKKQAPKGGVDEFSPESLFKAKIKVIGIGGGGGSIVSEFGRSLQKASFIIADTDVRALKKKPGIKCFWFGQEFTHGLGTGVDVDLARRAAESEKEKIDPILKDQDIVILVASLGGGLGSGATQVFAEAAKKFGGITLGIFTMPFRFEGKNKYRIAQAALKNLKSLLNVSVVIPNERIFKIIDESTPIVNAFSIVNKTLMESLESLIELIYNPGIINIDFADLKAILKGRGSSAFLNTVEESGNGRADRICENIFKNPLLQNNALEAEKILFNIAGSEKLSMFEVEKISRHISAVSPKAKIIFGISKDPKLKNKIKTTILMTGGQIKESIRPRKQKKQEEPKEAIVKENKKQAKKEIVAVETIKKEKRRVSSKKPEKIKPRKKPAVATKKPAVPNEEKPAKEESPVSFIPVPEIPVPIPIMPVLEQKKIDILETQQVLAKKTIRRSGLEIKKAEELAERKKMAQEKEWEIPAFLRKVKFKS